MLNTTSDIFTRLKNQLDVLTCCLKWLPHGRRAGNEWVCTNPLRRDSREGSFCINISTGKWSDFALSDAKGGDVISLYAYLHGIPQLEAAQRIEHEFSLNVITINPNKNIKKMPIINTYIPIPEHATTLDFGVPSGLWAYQDEYGNFILYLTRHNLPNGKKSFKPHTFANVDGVDQWIEKGLYKNGESIRKKPLYNLQMLKNFPKNEILLVEGEKTADRANELLNDYVGMSWLGGAQCADKVDLEPLRDRVVWLWPDNDDPGKKAMLTIKQRLSGIALECHLVDTSLLGELPKGWDLADCTPELHSKLTSCFVKSNDNDSFIEFDYKKCPHLGGSEKNPVPKDTSHNIKFLLDHYNIKLRWNLMSRQREMFVPNTDFFLEERDNAQLNYVRDLALINNVKASNYLDNHLDQIAYQDAYHPVGEWILSQPLYNKGILNDFLSIIKTTDDKLSHQLIKTWMISAIACIFEPEGFATQGVLVIQGVTGYQKSRFIMSLAPKSLNAVLGGALLDPTNKDNVLTLIAYWLAELAELDGTMRKADSGRLKAYITNMLDDLRRPYARKNSKMVRRTAMIATVNDPTFLVDLTGNRRWWTISLIEKINLDHSLDMQQVWREAYELYISGEKPYLSDAVLCELNQSNEQFEIVHPFQEKIEKIYNLSSSNREWVTATQILESIGYEKPTKSDVTIMGLILSKMGIKKGTSTSRMRRHYDMPKLMPSYENSYQSPYGK